MIVLLFLSVSNTAYFINGYVHNMSKPIPKYLEYCGSEYLCSRLNENSFLKIPNTRDSHKCPSCSCSEHCDLSRNCCVDESYSTCVQNTIPHNMSNQNKSYQMVSYCPNLYEICLQPITENNFLYQIPAGVFFRYKQDLCKYQLF